eukprot:GILJ01001051.1.p1 GENE.GILJ01001051.1~~GILJ01001051.1.p1  ORF type:complete len:618 (+),score=74.60 GILJ01001051.1:97-1950(+)
MDDFEEEFNSTELDSKQVTVFRNGKLAPDDRGVTLKILPRQSFSEFLNVAGQNLGITGKRLFSAAGEEIRDLDLVRVDEALYISSGENFHQPSSSHGTTQLVAGFLVDRKLGKGGFGSVMLGIHSITSERAAIKYVEKGSLLNTSDAERAFMEIQALRDLQHRHVIKLIDVVDDPHFVCFIMEYAGGGELLQYLQNKGQLTEDDARRFFMQIVSAVAYCHSRGVIHRDLKLENILLGENEEVKVADFGLSGFVMPGGKARTRGGSLAYIAPEVLTGKSQESDPFKLDVWAMGVILYTLVVGQLPFRGHNEKETIKKIVQGDIHYHDVDVSSEFRDIIKRMLTVDAVQRMSVAEMTCHRWVDKANLYNMDHANTSPARDTAAADQQTKSSHEADSKQLEHDEDSPSKRSSLRLHGSMKSPLKPRYLTVNTEEPSRPSSRFSQRATSLSSKPAGLRRDSLTGDTLSTPRSPRGKSCSPVSPLLSPQSGDDKPHITVLASDSPAARSLMRTSSAGRRPNLTALITTKPKPVDRSRAFSLGSNSLMSPKTPISPSPISPPPAMKSPKLGGLPGLSSAARDKAIKNIAALDKNKILPFISESKKTRSPEIIQRPSTSKSPGH